MSLIDKERIKLISLQGMISSELKRFSATYDTLLTGETSYIDEICKYVKNGKSKQFRPTLLLVAAKSDQNTSDEVITAAACVEMIHTATLLHDDFIDESDTRRGQPSVNAKYGNAVALIMGDYLYSKALDTLGSNEMFEPLALLSKTTMLMSKAEMLQQETRDDLSIPEEKYLEIIDCKTGSLIESACTIGAGFNKELSKHKDAFGTFGLNLGRVFQITDDLFDYLGDPRRLGKPTGLDWSEGRITLPFIYAFNNADSQSKDNLLAEYQECKSGTLDSMWPEVKSFVDQFGGIDYARSLAAKFGDDAKNAICDVASGRQRELLDVSVEYVLNRLK
ncbi:polyprenyl synthetase family protein [bacterium]|nr:polyprenyl synthetase family protein [bacterium]